MLILDAFAFMFDGWTEKSIWLGFIGRAFDPWDVIFQTDCENAETFAGYPNAVEKFQ